MAIKRYLANKDNTIVNAYKPNLRTRATGSNMGQADVLEVYSIYGRESSGSQELSRILVEFPISDINTDRTAGTIPASGSVSFYLRLYNAETSKTVPRNFTIVAQAVSRSWTEGDGLDLENYKDKGESNWVSASSTTAWTTAGGDYYTDSDITTSQNFDIGTEDLEVNVSEIVERQIKYITEGEGQAVVYIYFNGATKTSYASNFHKVQFENTEGTTQLFTFNDSNDLTTNGSVGLASLGTADVAGVATRFAASINDSTVASLGLSASVETSLSSDGKLVKVVQDIGGTAGNTEIKVGNNLTPLTSTANTFIAIFRVFRESAATPTFDKDTGYLTGDQTTQFFDGVDTLPNYGFGVFLTSSQESATRSYYTKRFFARGSQYFFKRPVIEARWNSSVQDDRGDFYMSSSLAPAADNLNTLYLYNYIRGQLTNIPAIGTGEIYVDLYETLGGTALTQAINTPATGGYVSTGIYSCSVSLTGTYTTLRDVWYSGSTEYFTGTISPQTFGAAAVSTGNARYVTNIKNLRNKYFSEEEARFNVYVRSKNWSPTIYTVASEEIENTIIPSASYRVYRVIDGYNAIPHGTGSELQTLLSYDVSGNYFNLDMSLLEPGYEYGIKLAFYDSQRQTWIEQDQKFLFRVEDYEY